jgi:hypothetical protein
MPGVKFFVPGSNDDAHSERLYEALCALVGRPTAPQGERVYSIEFESNAEAWTATVGQPMRGERTRVRQRNKVRKQVTER